MAARGRRAAIWRNTIATTAGYCMAIAVVDRLLETRFEMGRSMTLAMAFATVQVVVILLMVISLFARKQWRAMNEERQRRLGPEIREALALHAIGEDQSARLEQLHRSAPEAVREMLLAMSAATRGAPGENLANLAFQLGLVERERQPALSWIRNLARVRHAQSFEAIVTFAARQSLLVRAIAAEELAPFAPEIPDAEIGRVLRSDDSAVVIMTLDMLRAWRRARHIPDFAKLLLHGEPRVRARAFLALPYAAAGAIPEAMAPAVVAALRDDEADVREAAATAAGRLGLSGAVEPLGGRLSDPRQEVAVAAAFALASLGDRGNALLQKAVLSPNRAAAAVAFEAMEKSALGLAESV